MVDDDGLGYHDDGEETYSDQEKNAKRQSAVAAGVITSKALNPLEPKILKVPSRDFQ